MDDPRLLPVKAIQSMVLPSLAGLALGAALMMAGRLWPGGLLLVPVAIAIGPLLIAWRGRRPSKAFVILYVLAAGTLFTLMALTSPGFRNNFDPP
jgi:hypothetical protein